MTFTYDLTTDIGAVRLYIGDRAEGDGILPSGDNYTDEEIEAILARLNDDVEAASVVLLESAARRWGTMVDVTMGPLKEAYSQASKSLMSLAGKMREDYDVAVSACAVTFDREDGYSEAADENDYQ